MDILLTDEEITKHELPDGGFDITGLLQAQLKKVVELMNQHRREGVLFDDPFAKFDIPTEDWQALLKEAG